MSDYNDMAEAISQWCCLTDDADISITISDTGAQKQWSSAVNKMKLKRLHETNSNPAKARLLAYEGKIPGAWLNAYPSKMLGLKLTDDQTRISLGLRLGAKTCEAHICSCGNEVQEDGKHGLACKKSAGRHPRHSMINDIVKRALASAGLPSQLEPVGLT